MINTLAEIIKKRKWDMLVIIALLGSLFVAVPMAINYTINKAMDDSIAPLIQSIEDIKDDVSSMKRQAENEIRERAISAYTKIYTVEDLNNNPSNKINIKMGLLDPSTRSLLMIQDRDRTLLFIDFLFPDGMEDYD